MKNAVIYTCITDDYDKLEDHTYINQEWDYICFTDNPCLENKVFKSWKIRKLEFNLLDNTRNQRWHKTHPHLLFPKCKKSLWLDANADVLNKRLFKDLERSDKRGESISIAPHPLRNCAYDELEACIFLDKDDKKIMRQQMLRYKKDNFPKKNGLYETNVIYREHHNKTVIKIMEEWWWWIKSYSKRDQLSINYVLWKNNIKARPLTNKSYRNDERRIKFWPHHNEVRKILSDLERRVKLLEKENDRMRQVVEDAEDLRLFNFNQW